MGACSTCCATVEKTEEIHVDGLIYPTTKKDDRAIRKYNIGFYELSFCVDEKSESLDLYDSMTDFDDWLKGIE